MFFACTEQTSSNLFHPFSTRKKRDEKMTCPYLVEICIGRAAGACTKRVKVCKATANSGGNDGSGFLVDELREFGWGYCEGEYAKCPLYRWYNKLS